MKVSNMLSNMNGNIDKTLLRKQDLLDKKMEEMKENPPSGKLQQVADEIRMDKEQNELNAKMEQALKKTQSEKAKKQLEEEKERLKSMADPKMADFMLEVEMMSRNILKAATQDDLTTEEDIP